MRDYQNLGSKYANKYDKLHMIQLQNIFRQVHIIFIGRITNLTFNIYIFYINVIRSMNITGKIY